MVRGEEDEGPDVVERRSGRSGVDYTDSVVIHDSSKMRIDAVAFYVPRSEGEEFAFKLVRTRKEGIFRAGVPDEISLNAVASLKLAEWLSRRMALVGQPVGPNLVLPLSAESDLGGEDPERVADVVLKILAHPRVAKRLMEDQLADEVATALQSGLRVRDLTIGLSELRALLDTQTPDESVYQQWCKRHAWVFGGAYADPDLTRRIAVGDEVDLLLPLVVNGLRDIVELKRPTHEVLKWDNSHKNWYFGLDVVKAIGQCDRYLDRLHQSVSTGQLMDHPEITAHRPRALIVIGRSDAWDADRQRALHSLNGRLHGITVMTYDHLVAQGERMLALTEQQASATAVSSQ